MPETRIFVSRVDREGVAVRRVDVLYEVLRESDQKWITRYRLVFIYRGDKMETLVRERYSEFGSLEQDSGVYGPDIIYHRMARRARAIIFEPRT